MEANEAQMADHHRPANFPTHCDAHPNQLIGIPSISASVYC